MKYLSLCSGIEAATVAWHPLGWEAVAYSEIERFPSEVLAHHYPNTPNLGDMTKFKEWTNVSDVDLLVGGTPCQSFSVAGLRKGLDDPRGNLMLTYLAIAKQHRPNWLVWENVPGVLSSNGGRDFGSFLGGLAECGYGFAYRVLDAQFFGVAQRRRRVFVVGYLGDWRAAAAVLFERHSLQGHPAPSREKRQSVTASVGAGADGGNADRVIIGHAEVTSALCASDGPKGVSDQYAHEGKLIAMAHGQGGAEISFDRSPTLTCVHEAPIILDRAAFNQGANAQYKFRAEHSETMDSLVARGPHAVLQPAYGIPGNWIGRKPENGGNATEPMYDIAPCLTKADQHGVAQPICLMDQGGSVMNIEHDMTGTLRRETHGHEPIVMQPVGAFKPGQSAQAHSIGYESEMAPTLEAGSGGNNKPAVHVGMAVRRLTPKECERLQGFPDGYTDIKSKNKPTPDGPRYKALGNSMAVPVMAWIGQRIEQVEAICKQNK
jgi:DNA (cytosine-5)-methyltransferase 1